MSYYYNFVAIYLIFNKIIVSLQPFLDLFEFAGITKHFKKLLINELLLF